MVDLDTVCCMCGDVGFPQKLFRCVRCLSRFQHSYCSNYYEESSSNADGGVCDWCRSEERSGARHGGVLYSKNKPPTGKETAATLNRSDYNLAGERIKQSTSSNDREDGGGGAAFAGGGRVKSGGSSSSSSSSSKPSGRRYKLLKDVLC